MSLKRAREGSTTADAGKDGGTEHVASLVEGMSETVHSEDEAGRTDSDSEYEWEKTANGFKRRRNGAQGWTVYLFMFDVLPKTTANLICIF